MTRSITAVLLCLIVPLAAQEKPRAREPEASPPPATVRVPTFENSTCPIMGKRVSMPLFVDTEAGRFYVCCKPCYRKILRNVPAAHKTAYPVVEAVVNERCPVSGEPIGEHAVSLTLQGFSFRLCCASCSEVARRQSQLTLTKVTEPEVVDLHNDTCPITGDPVAANAFVLIGNTLVRTSGPECAEAAAADPAKVVAKARQIASDQPPREPHEHAPAPEQTPGPKPDAKQGRRR